MADVEELQRELREIQSKVADAERQLERVSNEMQAFARAIDGIESALRQFDGDVT